MNRGNVVKEGSLKKKGRLNPQLQDRRFVLCGNLLQYFDGQKPKGEIDIRGGVATVKDSSTFTFQLDAQDRAYLLQANSALDMKEWVDTLNSHISTLPSPAASKMSKRDKFKQAFTSKSSRVERNTKTESVREDKVEPVRETKVEPVRETRVESVRETKVEAPRREEVVSSQQGLPDLSSPFPTTPSTRSETKRSSPVRQSLPSIDPPPPRESVSSSSSSQGKRESIRPASPPFPAVPSSKPEEPTSSSFKRRSVFFTQPSSSSSQSSSTDSTKTTFDTFPDEVTAVYILKKGPLRKRGEVNLMFKERTFILTKSSHFAYFDDRMLRKGVISLCNRSLLLTSVANFEWKLIPNEPGGREFVLRANSQSEMNEWISAISSAMEHVSKLMRARTKAALPPMVPSGSGSGGSGPRESVRNSLDNPPLRTGVLLKKGPRSTSLWRERNVKLYRSSLEYYEENEMKGIIDLTATHRVAISDENQLEFSIAPPSDGTSRVYFFRCKSRPELDGWVARIRQCIQELSSTRQSVRVASVEPSSSPPLSNPPVGDSDSTHSFYSSSLSIESLAALSDSGSSTQKSVVPHSHDSSASFPPVTSSADAPPITLEELPVLEEIAVEKGEGGEEDLQDLKLKELEEEIDDETRPTKKPKWVADEASDKCMFCKIEFSLLVRKHHCRSCGRLLCAECTPSFIALPDLGYSDPVRVCIRCIDRFYRHAPKQTDEGCVIS